MEFQIRFPLLVFTLFLLVHINGVHGRPIQTVHHHHHEGHEEDDHDLINNIFFHQKDLKKGNSIPLFFAIRNPNKTPKFLPKSVSDSLPFNLLHLPSILQTLKINPNSPQAKSMSETLTHCQKPPINGESKFCSSSLESMLESVQSEFGSYPELLTTSSRAGYRGLQKFTLVEDSKVIEAPNAMACHPMPYPYAVFYCHGQKGSNRLYEMETETIRDGDRVRVRVQMLGMCHMDTSEWDPNHLAFKMLGIRPGQEPVCHAFPTDTLVWVPKQNSTSSVIKTVV